MQYMHDAEKILMTDYPIAPIYYYTHPILLKSKVKGLVLSTLGFVDWKSVTISG